MPLPGLLYAQVVKRMRRRRVVEVIHRVVVGTQEAVDQVLDPCGGRLTLFRRAAQSEPAPASRGHSATQRSIL